MQNAVDEDAYEMVNVADWEHLMAFYGTESNLGASHPARWSVSGCSCPLLPGPDYPCSSAGAHVLLQAGMSQPVTPTRLHDALLNSHPVIIGLL